jgi:DNA-binding NarL/FixJ family response regulator
VIISVCSAPRHGARYAYGRDRCNCPAAADRRAAYKRWAPRKYIPGRIVNRIDEAAVERAVGGDRSLVLTVDERRAAIDRLDALGFTATAVAVRLGITVRTVQRQRERRRAAESRRQEASTA